MRRSIRLGTAMRSAIRGNRTKTSNRGDQFGPVSVVLSKRTLRTPPHERGRPRDPRIVISFSRFVWVAGGCSGLFP